MNNLVQSKPELASDPNVQQTLAIAEGAQKQLNEISTQLTQMAQQHELAMGAFKKANDFLTQVNDGLHQINAGVGQLESGSKQLINRLRHGASGSGQIAEKTAVLQSGVTQINDGQKQLLGVLNDLQNQMGKLESGLSTSSEGLDKVSGGLKDAQKFLSDFSKSKTTERFYIPQKVLEGKDFREYLDMYMSNDRTLVKMTISGHQPIF